MIFSSISEYEHFVYSLQDKYPIIETSTLVLIPKGKSLALVKGSILFSKKIRLEIKELVDFLQSKILRYSYEVFRGDEKLYWYDPQPHLEETTLLENFPHHKHILPDIKHHRIPAAEISFDKPNLPFLIEEIVKKFAFVQKGQN